MIRVGAVDLGSNSTRLLVADVEGDTVEEVERRLEITRLGEKVDRRRLLLPTAVARVRNVLNHYRRVLADRGAERTLAVATSAVRDAENGEAFLGEVEWSYGFATRLLSGEDEARLTFRGVSSGGFEPGEKLVVDVGGGSTELVLGTRAHGVRFHTSLDVGCVRLSERFPSDPDGAGAHVRTLLREHLPAELRPALAVGVAGTVTQLATLRLGLEREEPALVHGHVLPASWLTAEVERLAGMDVGAIRALRGMHPDRAPVIVAGAVVVREVLAHLGLAELHVSERDLLHGAALAAAELPAPVEGDAPPGAYTCC